jgi:hypothetical protein
VENQTMMHYLLFRSFFSRCSSELEKLPVLEKLRLASPVEGARGFTL